MKIRHEQLLNSLKRTLAPMYCLHGDEPLLLLEAALSIRLSAEAAGFSERETLTPENSTQWKEIQPLYYEQSLFSEKTLLECHLQTGKLGKEGSAILKGWAEKINSNKCLILICGKLEQTSQQSAWFKSLEKYGVVVYVNKLQQNQYPHWIKQRVEQKGKQIHDDALLCLLDHLHGNLLALSQEIDNLCLLSKEPVITLDLVLDSVTENRQYTPYEFIDLALLGEVVATRNCAYQLKKEGTEPILLLWLLTKQCRELLQMSLLQEQGSPVEDRKPLIRQALLTSSYSHWQDSLELAFAADKIIKGVSKGNIWQALLLLAYSMNASTRTVGL